MISTIATTAEDTATVRQGLDLWTLGMYASRNPDGSGPQLNRQDQVFSSYHASIPLREAGGTMNFMNINTDFDMTDLSCADVQYICTELDRNPVQRFEYTARPDRSVLVDCFSVENCRGMLSLHLFKKKSEKKREKNQRKEEKKSSRNCDQKIICSTVIFFHLKTVVLESHFDEFKMFVVDISSGLLITGLEWSYEAEKISGNKPDAATMNIDIFSQAGSSTVRGQRLWRIGVFGAKNEAGIGERLGYKRQVLTKDIASTRMTPGYSMNFDQVSTKFDFTQLGCDSEYQYFCIEFAKGFQAEPDFAVSYDQGGDAIIDCKPYECQRRKYLIPVFLKIKSTVIKTWFQLFSPYERESYFSYNTNTSFLVVRLINITFFITILFSAVKVSDVSATLFSNGGLTEGSRFNRIMFELAAQTERDSGAAAGQNLWELSVYGSQSVSCQGPRSSPQSYYTMSRRQADTPVSGEGLDINFGAVDINFDMTGHTCNDVMYICAELKKGSRPTPDFEFVPVPDRSVLTDSMPVQCEGLCLK